MKETTLLLVDESEEELKRQKEFLNIIGYPNVDCVTAADKAWLRLKTSRILCVISSYEMKEMSGLSLLKIARSDENLAGLPFFLTDPAFTTIKIIKAGQAGATGLIVSPCTLDTLKKKIVPTLAGIEEPRIRKVMADLEKGTELISRGRYEEALEIFYALINQNETPEYYFNIGYIKAAQGKHAEAIDAFRRATCLDRLFAKAYKEMSKAFRALGRAREAEECLQQAAEIYLEKDKIDNAEEVLNELLDSGSDSLNVFNTLGVIFRKKGKFEKALTHYKKALKVHPDEPYIHYNIGRLYLDMKEIATARKQFCKALELDPGFEDARQVIRAIDLGAI